MNGLTGVTKTYQFLLRLYPASFRDEFEGEMLSDFLDMAADARGKGGFAFALFCLRELIDFPINLLQAHWKENRVIRVLRTQPVNYGLRGALGFGLAFGLAILISQFVSLLLLGISGSIVDRLQVYFYDLFHTTHGLELISWIPSALSSLVTGLFLGILFAFLFADRSKYTRYILVTMLCWFLHDAVNNSLVYSTDLDAFLGSSHILYFHKMSAAFSGASLGLIFYAVKNERWRSNRMLVIGAISSPLIAYLYIHLLFALSIIETPWMFISLAALLIVYIGAIFFMAVRSGSVSKIPWLVVLGAIAYPALPYAGSFLVRFLFWLIEAPMMPVRTTVGGPEFWRLMLSVALEQAVYGILFGILIGLGLGLQKKSLLTPSLRQ